MGGTDLSGVALPDVDDKGILEPGVLADGLKEIDEPLEEFLEFCAKLILILVNCMDTNYKMPMSTIKL